MRDCLLAAACLVVLSNSHALGQTFLTEEQQKEASLFLANARTTKSIPRDEFLGMLKMLYEHEQAVDGAAKEATRTGEFKEFINSVTQVVSAINLKLTAYQNERSQLYPHAMENANLKIWHPFYAARFLTVDGKVQKLKAINFKPNWLGPRMLVMIMMGRNLNKEDFWDLSMHLQGWVSSRQKDSFAKRFMLYDGKDNYWHVTSLEGFLKYCNDTNRTPSQMRQRFDLLLSGMRKEVAILKSITPSDFTPGTGDAKAALKEIYSVSN